MNFFYYLIRGGGYILARLPMPVLYLISDAMAFLACDVFKYRKRVVMKNICRALPGRSDEEYKKIIKDFYRGFADVLVESFKMLGMGNEFIRKRIRLENPEVLQYLKDKNRGFIAVGGHFGNWEWLGVGMHQLTGMKSVVTYKPLSSKLMDKLMKQIRSENGTMLVTMANTYRIVLQSKEPLGVLLVADQSPDPRTAIWVDFLGLETAWFSGPEKISKGTNSPLVFFALEREKRGYYKLRIDILHEHPAEAEEQELTRLHVKALEKLILKKPSDWLWSHKRWKHKRA